MNSRFARGGGFSKDQVVALAEHLDTDREINFYDKASSAHPLFLRDTLVYSIGICLAIAAFVFPRPVSDFGWESAVNMEVALISAGLTVYALAFTFVDKVYYGINVIDYSLMLRPGTVSPRANALVSVVCFVFTFATAWANCGPLRFALTAICVTAMVDLLLSLVELYTGTGLLHGEIRTFVIQEIIGQARVLPERTHSYFLDLFEDASRNYLQGSNSKLEDDLYAIRCAYGSLSKDIITLGEDAVDLLLALRKSTGQLANNLARSGDYRHALILTRRCMSRVLANDSVALASNDESVYIPVSGFDLAEPLLSILATLVQVDVFTERLYDLMRDNLFVYGMAASVSNRSSSGPFSHDSFDQLAEQARRSIVDNSMMDEEKKAACLRLVFGIGEDEWTSYRRMDGQNNNRYYYDLTRYA